MPHHASLPQFLVVGAQRSGTTYLHHLLSQHPGVHMPPEKELHYFDLVPVRGNDVDLDQYAAAFAGAAAGQIVGEATPSYMYFPWVPELLAAHLPEARLIFVLRDPVDRAYSQYWKAVREGWERLTFERGLAAEAGRLQGSHRDRVAFSYRDRGFYMRQIDRFRPLFPRERMLFLRADDLYASPAEVLRTVCAFIGAPLEFELGEHRTHLEHASVPDHLALYRRLVGVERATNGRPGVWRVGRAAKRLRMGFARRDGRYPPMKEATRRRLAGGFQRDASALAAFLDVDLGHWSVFRDGGPPNPTEAASPRSSAAELSAPGPG
ncbi:MAG: sulfotransferase domain-containing protein [Actinomycetota bacterium]|nr:sulfotransferase domain-containing protein [Actinomycetota bacterium]